MGPVVIDNRLSSEPIQIEGRAVDSVDDPERPTRDLEQAETTNRSCPQSC